MRSHDAYRSQIPTLASASAQAATAASVLDIPTQLPATYKRLVADRVGSSFKEVARVQEAPLPTLAPDEVLVRIAFAGINGGCETFRARGEHAFAPNRLRQGFALGAEGSGVVAAVGEAVRNLQVGQAVAVNGASAFAEYAAAKAAMCTPLAAGVRLDEAAALTLSAVTAAVALDATGRLQAGEVLLVTAAAGGTGHFAVQLGLAAGAHVVAVCGSAAKAAALRSLAYAGGAPGTLSVVDRSATPDVAAAVHACVAECGVAEGGGVDVVYDGVGGALRAALRPLLAPGGRWLQVGYISEYPHTGSSPPSEAEAGVTSEHLFWQGLTLQAEGGRTIHGQVWPKDPRAIRRSKQRVWDLHAEGRLVGWVDSSHGFKGVEQVPDAVDYMLRGGHIGKVVIPITAGP